MILKKFFVKFPNHGQFFILNPILIRYDSTIGLFLTPKYANDYHINECSEFVKLKTDYPLFLKYNSNPEIKIVYEKLIPEKWEAHITILMQKDASWDMWRQFWLIKYIVTPEWAKMVDEFYYWEDQDIDKEKLEKITKW